MPRAHLTTDRRPTHASHAALVALDLMLPMRDPWRKRELISVLSTARFGRARDLVRGQRIIYFITAFPEDRHVRIRDHDRLRAALARAAQHAALRS